MAEPSSGNSVREPTPSDPGHSTPGASIAQEVHDAIQRERARTELIVASLADGAFTVDRALHVRSFSAGMEWLTGIDPREVLGRPCREVFNGSLCDSDCPLRGTFEQRGSVERCHEWFQVRGRAVLVSMTTALLPGPAADDIVIAAVHDMTAIERFRELAEQSACDVAFGRTQQGEPAPADAVEGGAAHGEAAELQRTLESYRWNATRTARALNISRTTLWRRMRKFGLLKRP